MTGNLALFSFLVMLFVCFNKSFFFSSFASFCSYPIGGFFCWILLFSSKTLYRTTHFHQTFNQQIPKSHFLLSNFFFSLSWLLLQRLPLLLLWRPSNRVFFLLSNEKCDCFNYIVHIRIEKWDATTQKWRHDHALLQSDIFPICFIVIFMVLHGFFLLFLSPSVLLLLVISLDWHFVFSSIGLVFSPLVGFPQLISNVRIFSSSILWFNTSSTLRVANEVVQFSSSFFLIDILTLHHYWLRMLYSSFLNSLFIWIDVCFVF